MSGCLGLPPLSRGPLHRVCEDEGTCSHAQQQKRKRNLSRRAQLSDLTHRLSDTALAGSVCREERDAGGEECESERTKQQARSKLHESLRKELTKQYRES